jgi:dipeptidyl-peptidase 4
MDKPRSFRLRPIGAGLSLSLLLLTGTPWEGKGQDLQTAAEASGFARHTTHSEMVEYLREVKARSPEMGLLRYGSSLENRELYLAVFSRPRVGAPSEARASGRPVVLLGANVHGFNYILRESLLLLIRELATPGSEANRLLDEVIVLVAPSKNPDGLEAGSRFNAIGADLNRDYMALEQPSMQAWVGQVLNRWDPHLVLDGHDGGAVQYGGARPYSLLYQGPALAGADPRLTQLADQEIFPRLNRAFEEVGREAFYWARGDRDRWYGGGAAPRMGRNYGGLANKVTILFEFAEWHEKDEAVELGVRAFRTVLEYARDRGDVLVSLVEDARRRTVELGERAEGRIPVREVAEPAEFRVSYRIPGPEGEGYAEVRDAEIVKRPVGTTFRNRPWAYVLPPGAEGAARLLARHNIAVERLTAPAEIPVEFYTVAEITFEEGTNGHRVAPHLEVGEVRTETVTLETGSYKIRTGQPLGRVVAHLLEPETTDGLVHWNQLAPFLPLAELEAHRRDPALHPMPVLPVYKIMGPAALRTEAWEPAGPRSGTRSTR